MNKPVLLIPFIVVSRIVLFVVKIPFKIVQYNINAVLWFCYVWHRFLRYFVTGLCLPIILLVKRLQKPKKTVKQQSIVKPNIKLADRPIAEMMATPAVVKTTIPQIPFSVVATDKKVAAIERRKQLQAKEEERRKEQQLLEMQQQLERQQQKEQARLEKEKIEEEQRILREQKLEEKRRLKEERQQAKKQVSEIKQQQLELKRQRQEEKLEQRQKQLEEKEQIRLAKEKEKEKQLIEKQQAIKERKEAKALKNKRINETYKNEDVVIEKENKLGKAFVAFMSSPKTIRKKFHNSYENSTFVKNRKNKLEIKRQALLIDFEGDDAVKSEQKIMYEYVGKNAEGKVTKGYFDAFSKVEVHSYLLSEGFEVYSIKSSKWITFLHGRSVMGNGKFKTKDLIFFLTQLSTYIKSGITLIEALRILSRQYIRNKKYQSMFKMMIYDLTMGENFSEAMSKQGNTFPRLLINMIKTSEMTGELPEVLDDMAEYYTKTEKTRKQMVSAMMYPTIIFFVSIAVVTFILLFVIPKFVDIYESMDASKIPAFTLMVMGASNFLQANAIWIFLGLILFIILYTFLYNRVKFIKTVTQWVTMHIPVIGNIIIYNEVTMFTKTFGSLLAHNVFITDSMEVLNRITGNEIYKMIILDTISNLARGNTISVAFKDHWAFPIPAYEMLVTGEKTGRLPEMMLKVSDYYQELHANSVSRLKAFIEPFLIIFLTAIVGTIVLAIVIPMFSMYEAIQ